jgi:hypothetical protein
MNDLTLTGGGLPSVFQSRRSSLNAAAQANVQASFGIIGYKGRNFRIKYRSEETLLKDERGVPLPTLEVVIVGVASGISKQFYEKGFVEGDSAAPDCFSVNGTAPDASSPKKQCSTCAVCPKNQWGSKITESGSKGKACQDSRRISVVPAGDLENEMFGGPMLLRLPPTTLAAFAQYGAMLDKKGAGMEYVKTEIGFDYDVAYPKMTFKATGWLSEAEAVAVIGADGQSGICANPQVHRMLAEAVDEVAHDPAAVAAPVAAPVHDPLAAGGPAKVFAQPAPTVVAEPVHAPVAAPVQAAAPAPVAPAPAPNVVQAAPSDMESAIDDLLNAPI